MPEIVLDSANLPPRPPQIPRTQAEDMTERIPNVSRARRHIIKRPRLTRLLDETSARIILLVAPAGYGKTTLAREWLEGSGRPYAWYGATAASADVAAFSRGIAGALRPFAPEAEARLIARLQVRERPPDEADLAELFIDEVREWPDDLWLVTDDYHLVAADSACNDFITLLVERLSPQLLLASRRRPPWATARRILYGQIAEVGKELLAFTNDEGAAVLARHDHPPAPGFLALAKGWPAVVGLAAITGHVDLPEGSLPDPLYDYIARELYHSASESTRRWLPQLAISNRPSKRLAAAVAGEEAVSVLEEALSLELCTIDDGVLEVHPLFLQFLRRQLNNLDESELSLLATKAAHVHLQDGDPNEAFAVALRARLDSLMIEVLEASLDSALNEGRISTLEHWLDVTRARIQHPSLDVVEAEVAFARGEYERAEVLAARALRVLADDHPLVTRAKLRAGYSAYFRQDERTALQHFLGARDAALSEEDVVEALWGQFLCLVLFDVPHSESLLRDLEARRVSNEDEHVVRLAQGKLEVAHRSGNVDQALVVAQPARHLLPYVESHIRRTGFLNSLASTFNAAARFEEALEVATVEIEEARRSHIAFAMPHAHAARALAYLGLGRFREAGAELSRARSTIAPTDDHSDANVRSIQARLELARQEPERALAILEAEPRESLSRGMLGEYHATRALALVAAGAADDALMAADEADQAAPFGEPLVLTAAARTAAVADDPPEFNAHVANLVAQVRASGNRGVLLAACRACPVLTQAVIERAATLAPTLLATTHDRRLAAAAGVAVNLSPPDPEPHLTPREEEVLAMIAQGMRNREIAQALFIEEVTVKVHVRNLLRKLNVRTRTEAAVYLHQRG
jgi:LuxR family transcriptional regulator, maltose regulon positive regulatory protein